MSEDGRFAPSPTGRLHLGNLRTALAAWLWARSRGGRFLLRIDDLDPDRSRPEHEQSQLADLRQLELDWDGEPVRQRDRLERYGAVIAQLAEDDRTYPCFCSRAEIRSAASAAHGDSPGGAYAGTCAQMAPTSARARVTAGEPHALRVRAAGALHGYDDLLLGRVEAQVDDFVIRRRDGVPAYNLATVLDEFDMGIDTVVRGADLAPSTVRQHWLGAVIKLPRMPRFAHVALVLGPDGTRLAKRHGAVALEDLAAAGVQPSQVLGWLARSLDIDTGGDRVRHPSELLAAFDPCRLPTAPTRIDPADVPG